MMKILISAIACDPYSGSELYFGWSAVRALSRDHELWVMTSCRCRPGLERAQAEGLIPANVHFAYGERFKPSHPNRTLARLQSWKEYIHFSQDSLALAKKLHAAEKFDLVHHVTYTTFRVASPLWQLKIPFVFGPIAGNETFPFRLFSLLSFPGALFELARKTSNVVSRCSPKVRQSIRQADHIFTVTVESEELMKTLRGSSTGISQLSPGFYSPEKIAEFSRFVPQKKTDGVLRLYAAGNLGGQKCIALAFEALALVKKQGVKFRYLLGANGPEIPHLKKLVFKLGIAEDVIFGDAMSRAAYQQELGNTHIYLLPSMRETVGLTMLEAMLAGCVPVVADNGGPRLTVTEDCGYKIAVTTPKQMAKDIARVIIAIDRDREIISEKGAKASQRVASHSAEENYRQKINAVYSALVSAKARPA